MEQVSHLWREVQEWLNQLAYPPSQAKLGKRLGVTGNAISEWKYGESKPKPENLRALADEMEPVASPDIYQRLLAAVNRDQGYDPQVPRPGRRSAG